MATIALTTERSTGRVTLSTTTVDTVTFAQGGPFEVCNWTGTADLTITYGVTSGNQNIPTTTAATPVAGAASTWAVPAGKARRFNATPDATNDNSIVELTIKVLGNGNIYSIDTGF
jgi:hypothetical protein